MIEFISNFTNQFDVMDAIFWGIIITSQIIGFRYPLIVHHIMYVIALSVITFPDDRNLIIPAAIPVGSSIYASILKIRNPEQLRKFQNILDEQEILPPAQNIETMCLITNGINVLMWFSIFWWINISWLMVIPIFFSLLAARNHGNSTRIGIVINLSKKRSGD